MSAKNSESKMTEMDSKQAGNSTNSSNGYNNGEACCTNGTESSSKNKTSNSSKNSSYGKATDKAGSNQNCD